MWQSLSPHWTQRMSKAPPPSLCSLQVGSAPSVPTARLEEQSLLQRGTPGNLRFTHHFTQCDKRWLCSQAPPDLFSQLKRWGGTLRAACEMYQTVVCMKQDGWLRQIYTIEFGQRNVQFICTLGVKLIMLLVTGCVLTPTH